MEEEPNRTYIILSAHADLHKYRFCFRLVLTVYVLILCSNCTVVYLIWKQPDLHEPMYVFIAALLLNSVLLSTNIYPKLLLDFLSDTQVISHQACLLQFLLFYSFGYSEFLLLAAMAYDRYVSICRPLLYPSIMRRSTVSALLLAAWLAPAAQFVGLTVMISNQKLSSFTLRLIICNDSIYKLLSVRFHSCCVCVCRVFTLLSNAVLTMIFIVFTYTRILLICYSSSADVRRKAAHTCIPHLLVLSNFLFLGTFDVITARLDADFLTAHLIMILDLFNPLFNPIIYGLKMTEIHKYIKKSIR
ncbi:olfactory receptor 6N2-like [Betta splendens]|uniref:Olfactory receptor n=1 Tax=Betta splendens TaxID=158456 RepID=A0A6P7LG91_BETSP|nr:olfactory receptor 6N2-like [Betta splendens]